MTGDRLTFFRPIKRSKTFAPFLSGLFPAFDALDTFGARIEQYQFRLRTLSTDAGLHSPSYPCPHCGFLTSVDISRGRAITAATPTYPLCQPCARA